MRIGITGGIGSGKSAVSAYLRSLGETVLCADEAARQVVEPGQEGAAAIREAFGDSFFLADGSLNRKALGREVFADEEKRKRLEGILHPLIIAHIDRQAQDAGRVFIDAALLMQMGMHKKMDAVWLVTSDLKTRIERVIQRDGLSETDVLQRIESQPADEWMMQYADQIIKNNGELADLHMQIDKLIKQL